MNGLSFCVHFEFILSLISLYQFKRLNLFTLYYPCNVDSGKKLLPEYILLITIACGLIYFFTNDICYNDMDAFLASALHDKCKGCLEALPRTITMSCGRGMRGTVTSLLILTELQ